MRKKILIKLAKGCFQKDECYTCEYSSEPDSDGIRDNCKEADITMRKAVKLIPDLGYDEFNVARQPEMRELNEAFMKQVKITLRRFLNQGEK